MSVSPMSSSANRPDASAGLAGEDAGWSFRPDLQGLRAVAIALVLAAHAGVPYLQGGFVGVDVFFVLSGYLITGLLVGEFAREGRISFPRFYTRRLKRLLPALAAMLCGTFALAAWVLSGVEARAQLASLPYAAVWASNLYFAFSSFDYFDELSGRDLFMHTWSLGVEEQFYLLWPILLWTLLRGGRKGGYTLPGRLGLVALASLVLSVYLTWRFPQHGFYQMPSRIWQFSLGAMAYLSLGRSGPLGEGVRRMRALVPTQAMLGAGVLLILCSAAGLREGLAYPGFWALAPSIGAALVIAAGHGFPKERANPMAHPALIWLGDRSYSLYLWHWPFLTLGHSLGMGTPGEVAGLVLAALLAAMISYRFIELPFWKGRFSRAMPKPSLLAGLTAMLVVVTTATYGMRRLPAMGSPDEMSNKWRMDVPVIYVMPCDAWYHHDRVEPCVFGKQEARRTVVLLGDSIGAQWFSMLPRIFDPEDWRIVVLTKSSCAMVDEDYYYARIGQVFQVCTRWRNAVLDRLESIKPDVVLVGSAATYDFDEQSWVAGSERLLGRLSKAAGKVYVIPGTPTLGFDGPGCVARHLAQDGHVGRSACEAEDRMGQVDEVAAYLGAAAKPYPNVQLLDLNDLVCPEGRCNAVSADGVIVFRDSQHLTNSFVVSRAPSIRKRMGLDP